MKQRIRKTIGGLLIVAGVMFALAPAVSAQDGPDLPPTATFVTPDCNDGHGQDNNDLNGENPHCDEETSSTSEYVTSTTEEQTTSTSEEVTSTTEEATTSTSEEATTTTSVHETITICHATGSESNPYVEITVDLNGLNGHGDHPDDLIPAPKDGCPGPTTTTTAEETTTTVPETTTTTAAPTTTVPEVTTTVAAPTTTVASATTTAAPATTTAAPATTAAPVTTVGAPRSLATTGSNSTMLLFVALGLILLGVFTLGTGFLVRRKV